MHRYVYLVIVLANFEHNSLLRNQCPADYHVVVKMIKFLVISSKLAGKILLRESIVDFESWIYRSLLIASPVEPS